MFISMFIRTRTRTMMMNRNETKAKPTWRAKRPSCTTPAKQRDLRPVLSLSSVCPNFNRMTAPAMSRTTTKAPPAVAPSLRMRRAHQALQMAQKVLPI
jgi:hypothetical protein